MRSTPSLLILGGITLAATLIVSSYRAPTTALGAPGSYPPIMISATVPGDIPGNVPVPPGKMPNANIQQAAAFAWQEFIALTWPAVPQTGAPNTRDVADATGCLYEDPKCVGRPLAWETFRGKIEIFPGLVGGGTPQQPPGYNASATDFGYDATPAPPSSSTVPYPYGLGTPSTQTVVGPCSGQPTSGQTALVNLDETDQITVDAMYAGHGPMTGTGNSDPQLIRFLAKANRVEYDYVAKNQWWAGIPRPVKVATANYLAAHNADPPPAPPDTSPQTISLPFQTIEIKAAWRPLTTAEQQSGRFHMQTVRYYEFVGDPSAKTYCWRQSSTWGLVALHIIQKTPSAPFFIYATFEQADNIQTAGGVTAEAEDGSILVRQHRAPSATTPLEDLVDGPTPVPSTGMFPPKIALAPATAPYCTTSLQVRPKNQLYYLDADPGSLGAQPAKGFICVNYRRYPIPPQIAAVNRSAQTAIRAYEKAHGFAPPYKPPLSHYKLVNVQYFPYDNPAPGLFPGKDYSTGNNPASFYLANIVVETNRSLQQFNGGLMNNLIEAQYAGRFANPPVVIPGNPTHKNTVYGGNNPGHGNTPAGYNMGGCMGCHGSQGQSQGGNFSVILARGGGANQFPEAPAPIASNGLKPIPRNRRLVNY